MPLKVVTWNVEWAGPRSGKAPEIRDRINSHTPEIICLTEANIHLLAGPGHIICSQPDAGYRVNLKRRKVILWSREPWDEIDDLGHRFDASRTIHHRSHPDIIRQGNGSWSLHPLVRLPDRGPTRAQRKNQWEDHKQYLVGLTKVLRRYPSERLIVMGDFNQKIGPDSRASVSLRCALQTAFAPNMTIATADVTFQDHKSIDHIAVTHDWSVESPQVISNFHEGKKLSDHFGLAANLSLRRS